MERSELGPRERITVRVTRRERKLLAELNEIDARCLKRLHRVPGGKVLAGEFTLDEIERIFGAVDEAADGAPNARRRRELTALRDRLEEVWAVYEREEPAAPANGDQEWSTDPWQPVEAGPGFFRVDLGSGFEYDPLVAPDPAEWLAFDEEERIAIIREQHERDGEEIPNPRIHALLQSIVETQLAMKDEVVVETLGRLCDEGLDRHEALHAIAYVLLQNVFDTIKGPIESGQALPDRYYGALKELSARKWREMAEE